MFFVLKMNICYNAHLKIFNPDQRQSIFFLCVSLLPMKRQNEVVTVRMSILKARPPNIIGVLYLHQSEYIFQDRQNFATVNAIYPAILNLFSPVAEIKLNGGKRYTFGSVSLGCLYSSDLGSGVSTFIYLH